MLLLRQSLFVTLVTLLCALTGCQNPVHTFVGEWTIDPEASLAHVQEAGGEAAFGVATMVEMNMRVTIGSDGAYEMRLRNEYWEDGLDEQFGTYEVIDHDRNETTILVALEDAEPREHTLVVSGDSMTMEIDGRAAVFSRQ